MTLSLESTCTCFRWIAMIQYSTCFFIDLYHRELKSVSIRSLLFCTKHGMPPERRLAPLRYKEYLMDVDVHVLPNPLSKCLAPVGSCNGLVLLDDTLDGPFDGPSAGVPILWNPTSREIKILADSDYNRHCQYRYGLGFDPLTDDYKVIKVFYYDDRSRNHGEWQVWVYSLKANSWRRIQDHPCMPPQKIAGNTVFWVKPYGRTLITFNFVKETFHEIPLPQFSEPCMLNFGVSAGNLYCLYCHRYGHRSYVNIWRMNENGGGEFWCKHVSSFFRHPRGINECTAPEFLYMSTDEVMLCYRSETFFYNKLWIGLGLHHSKNTNGMRITHM